MTKSETKAQRILQIEALLLAHPEGLSQSEIARRLDVNRSTVHRYLPELTHHAPIFEEDGRLFINRESYLINLTLNIHEALSLHLAIRLLTTRMERHNPHSAALLRKLAHTIEKLTPQISHHLSRSADIIDDPFRFKDPHYISVLESLAVAWAEGRKVRVWHRHAETNEVYEYLFSVYFVEPYAVGQSIHAVGHREPPGDTRTFNLSRIERVELTKQYYKIPNNFDSSDLLKSAWGIWYTDRDPQEVVLRFSPNVASRVQETRWHHSQNMQLEEDGSLLWSVNIAEPKEMFPWIRGWGSDCEVISPPSLRNSLINELSKMQMVYVQPKRPPHMELWAKYHPGDETNWHPLLWHLLDSAAVTKVLWEDCLSTAFKSKLASSFQLSIGEMGNLLMFWVALHDIGKASPEFQKKNGSRQKALKSLGFDFPSENFKVDGFHATGTTLVIKRILGNDIYNIPRKFRVDLATTLGGHHGEFPNDNLLIKKGIEKFHVGDKSWQEVQETLFSELLSVLNVKLPVSFPAGNKLTNPFFLLLAGLTTTSDWISSNEDFFPFLNADLPPGDYFTIAVKQAQRALKELGWYGWKAKGDPATFEELFPEFSPNALQKAVVEKTPDLTSPFLAIIEAPTGSGKTEASFYLADTILQRDQNSGLYIAMPTQATSNQMFQRTGKFLGFRYADDELNLHLVHGASLLTSHEEKLKPNGIWDEELLELSNIRSHAWFLPRKRTLLAPFGVGTVDQTFLSVLKSKHFFLRLFGLSHKILIFDEVHAYDVYMTEIFKTLLHWLHAVGTSVIILSATLPFQTRKEFMQAYNADGEIVEDVEFPRLSIVSGGKSQVISAGHFSSRKIQLGWINKGVNSITSTLKDKLSQGGCAAVLCNRVQRAQEIYHAVTEAFNDEKIEIILFHGRFPLTWREDIESKVVTRFGKKNGERPQRSIVIATQVIEQSLDLDFDIMITDLAPIDLLIQRIGRLHRHENSSNPPARPEKLKHPQCIISAPAIGDRDSPPDFGSDSYIYSPYILYRTLLSLENRESLVLPKETDELINFVYSLESSASFTDKVWEYLKSMQSEMLKKHAESARNAHNYLIPLSNTSFFGRLSSSLSDDIQGITKGVLTAPTREISPSVDIVCLIKDDNGTYLLDNQQPIDLKIPPTTQQVRACLRSSVTINNWRVIKHFLNIDAPPPESFRQSAALRWHYPVIFEADMYTGDGFTLCLDKNHGLQINFE
ncbi:MAG: CRISPR-associated helicase Cas3' [Anaerolineaceae bacterium]